VEIAFSTLRPHLAEVLELLAAVVMRPSFRHDDFVLRKSRRLVQLRELNEQAAYIGRLAFQGLVHRDQPYGRPIFGWISSVQNIELEDVRRYWRTAFVPSNAALVIVGDVSRKDADAALDVALSAWTGCAATPHAGHATPASTPRTVHIIDRPGAVQSTIIMGGVGVPRCTPDFATLEVLNTVVGAEFTSRLNLALREEKGFTYGARSRFGYGIDTGSFSAAMSVDAPSTAAAMREMWRVLSDAFETRAFTPAETRFAVKFLLNGYPRRFESYGSIAREMAEIGVYGLRHDAPECFLKAVETVTERDLARVAAERSMLDTLTIVVVGDYDELRPALTALGLGPVRLLAPTDSAPTEQGPPHLSRGFRRGTDDSHAQ
jgi:zinc protease